ncbi:MAG TPA: hypothetical protein VK936_04940 [Longimicrobiales bacterium]|nr:hypothetical protein [Longimicrobiales bacterium]
MGHIVQRFGFQLGRGWIFLVVMTAIVLGGMYWIGPLRPLPAELELVVLAGDEPVDELAVPGELDAETGAVRFAVPLAVRNTGARPGTPRRITLSVPGRYRLITARGVLDSEVTPGVPLRRYVLSVSAPAIAPDGPPVRVRGLETVWIEPDLPSYYCMPVGDIPEFMPAPHIDAGTLADVRIFYSLTSREAERRRTGVLTLRLDPSRLQATPAAMPPVFPTSFEEPEVEAPDLGPLLYGGERRSYCGDPEQPMELFTVVWQTAAGGRFYVIYIDDAPRKHLYDLNGDGTIDLETWDATGDGRFEARREARYAVPEFLVPSPRRRADSLEPDTVPPDSAWLAVFNDPAAGPFRFTRRPAETGAAPGAVPGAPSPRTAAVEPLPPPDSAWLDLFLDTERGPFRFTRRAEPQQAEPGEPGDVPTQPLPGDTSPQTTPQPEAEPAEGPPAEPPAASPPSPRRTVPLGTPVPRRPPGGE